MFDRSLRLWQRCCTCMGSTDVYSGVPDRSMSRCDLSRSSIEFRDPEVSVCFHNLKNCNARVLSRVANKPCKFHRDKSVGVHLALVV